MSTDIGGVEVYVARGVRIQGRTQSFIIGPLSIAGQSTIPVAGKEAWVLKKAIELIYLPLGKMAAISQTILSTAFFKWIYKNFD